MPKTKPKKSTRAPKGLGSIRKRGESYEVSVPAGKRPDGRTRYVTATARSLEEAQRLRARLILEHQASAASAAAAGVTVAEWVEQRIERRRPEVRPNTYSAWRVQLKIIRRHLGAVPLAKLTVEHLENFYRALAAPGAGRPRGYSKSVIYHVKNLLNEALDAALRYGAISVHPGKLAEMPRIADRPEAGREVLPHELEALFELLTAHPDYRRYRALVYFLVALGLRRGEGLGLRKENVRYVPLGRAARGEAPSLLEALRAELRSRKPRYEWWLQVRQQVLPEANRTAVGPLKTGRAARDLPLSREALTLLLWQLEQLEEAYARGMPDHGWLFPNSLGDPQNPNNFGRAWRKMLELAKIPKARTHDLRGTFITRIVRETGNPKLAARLAGHVDVQMSLKHYVRTSEEDVRGALEGMQVFRRKPK